MAYDTTERMLEGAQGVALSAKELAEAAQSHADQIALAAHIVPSASSNPFVLYFSIFVISIFVGYYVVWSVTPALHTPLMSVTNAISSVIIVGALLVLGVESSPPGAMGAALANIFGFFALLLTSINIFAGFAVTDRMLLMYKKKDGC